jgi:hypothetical protein
MYVNNKWGYFGIEKLKLKILNNRNNKISEGNKRNVD